MQRVLYTHSFEVQLARANKLKTLLFLLCSKCSLHTVSIPLGQTSICSSSTRNDSRNSGQSPLHVGDRPLTKKSEEEIKEAIGFKPVSNSSTEPITLQTTALDDAETTAILPASSRGQDSPFVATADDCDDGVTNDGSAANVLRSTRQSSRSYVSLQYSSRDRSSRAHLTSPTYPAPDIIIEGVERVSRKEGHHMLTGALDQSVRDRYMQPLRTNLGSPVLSLQVAAPSLSSSEPHRTSISNPLQKVPGVSQQGGSAVDLELAMNDVVATDDCTPTSSDTPANIRSPPLTCTRATVGTSNANALKTSSIDTTASSPTSHVATLGDPVLSSEEMEVSQKPTKLSADQADHRKDTTLPSYGLIDLLGHDQTSYCFGGI